VGFTDLGYNVVFALRTLWPGALTYLQTAQVPILQGILSIPFVQDHLNAFADFDPTDKVQVSQHYACAYIYTLVPNTLVALAAATLLALAWPLVKMLAGLLLGLLYIAAMTGPLTLATLQLLLVMPGLVAHAAKRDTLSAGSRTTKLGVFLNRKFALGRRKFLAYQAARAQREAEEEGEELANLYV
jgi:hypothetical protein